MIWYLLHVGPLKQFWQVEVFYDQAVMAVILVMFAQIVLKPDSNDPVECPLSYESSCSVHHSRMGIL